MPRVPSLDRPQVATQALPTPRTTPMAEGMGTAAALQTGAQLVGGLANVVEQVRRQQGEVQVNAAEVQLRNLRNRIATDVLSREGRNAFDAPEAVDNDWVTGLSEIEADLTQPELRQAFRQRADILKAELQGQVGTHVQRQMDRVDAETTDALIADSMANVTKVPADTGQVAVDIARAESLLLGRLGREGKSDEYKAIKAKELRSGARLAQVQALVAQEQYDAASQIADLDAVKDDLLPQDAAKVRILVEDGNLTVRSQRAADDIFTKHGDSEAEALKAARGYEGKLRDEVVRRVEGRFADERRLFNQSVVDNVNTALNAVEQGGEVPSEQRDWLLTNAPDKLNQLTRRQRQVKNGTAVETDWDVYEDLFNGMTNAELAKVNPADYRADLSNADYKTLVNRVAMLNQTGGRGDGRLSPGQITSDLLQRSRAMGLIGARISTLSEMNKTPAIKTRFNALSDAVTAAMLDKETAEGRPLTGTEQRAVVQSVLDDQVMIQSGFGPFRRDVQTRPRAFVGQGTRTRELTPGERPAILNATELDRATRWQELRAQGLSVEEATQRVQQEMP